MSIKPAIALKRRHDAVVNFSRKLDIFDELLAANDLDRFPKRASVSSFASWSDAELGVLPISRSIIYDDADEYLPLKHRMEAMLERLELLRSKVGKKANLEVNLRARLNEAEARAKSYLNQYSTVKAELENAKKEIESLNQRISRQTAKRSKIFPLHAVQVTATTKD